MSEERFQVKIAGFTDTGLKRQRNQDHIGFDQDLGIAVLADGMGGHQSGEIASQMAVESVLEKLQSICEPKPTKSKTGSQLLDYVSNTISYSNSMIYQAAETVEEQRGMGTTLVAVMIQDSQIYAGHVGDSRLYLYRADSLRRITKDHSLVQDLIDRGFYTEEEARSANVGHIVTRALGTKAQVEVDTLQHDLKASDVFLLCSDGLSDMVAGWQIQEILKEQSSNLERAAKTLISKANRNGGKDNISVILMQISQAET
jgi:protein phosphatase